MDIIKKILIIEEEELNELEAILHENESSGKNYGLNDYEELKKYQISLSEDVFMNILVVGDSNGIYVKTNIEDSNGIYISSLDDRNQLAGKYLYETDQFLYIVSIESSITSLSASKINKHNNVIKDKMQNNICIIDKDGYYLSYSTINEKLYPHTNETKYLYHTAVIECTNKDCEVDAVIKMNDGWYAEKIIISSGDNQHTKIADK